jgi:hypothetical protein
MTSAGVAFYLPCAANCNVRWPTAYFPYAESAKPTAAIIKSEGITLLVRFSVSQMFLSRILSSAKSTLRSGLCSGPCSDRTSRLRKHLQICTSTRTVQPSLVFLAPKASKRSSDSALDRGRRTAPLAGLSYQSARRAMITITTKALISVNAAPALRRVDFV